jgi:hypothetical protein
MEQKAERRSGRRVPRSPFVVTVTLLAAGACGGQAFDDRGGGGSSGSGAGGSSGTSGAGGSGAQPGCPPTTPRSGTACTKGTVCSYSNGKCCPSTETRCVDWKWQVLVATCNPPPPVSCPDTPPLEGSPCGPINECSSGFGATCGWNLCNDGTYGAVGTCDGSVWHVQTKFCSTDCKAEFRALSDYAHSNRQCNSHEQCITRAGPCGQGADVCDGTFYVNQGVDDATWSALTAQLTDCMNRNEIDCVACDAIAPPAVCMNNVCQGGYVP